jgi:hypothetical protein
VVTGIQILQCPILSLHALNLNLKDLRFDIFDMVCIVVEKPLFG